jgi:molecular chaperone GrpE
MTTKSQSESEATAVKEDPEATAEQAAQAESVVIDPKDAELAVLKDRLLRLQADFDNFRKRTVRDREDMARRASERILKELLPAIDHFDLGIQAARKSHIKHAVVEGFEGILKQFQSILEKSGVTPIETRGQVFDPHSHECVTQIPSEEHPESMVIEETRKGYRLGTYVLRASQVIVSSGPATVTETTESEAEGN